MLTLDAILRPSSLEEAHALAKSRASVVLGGAAFLRLGHRRVQKGIDLSRLGLDTIEEDDNVLSLGAYVTYGDLSRHPLTRAYAEGALVGATDHIIGVQFQNLVTLGGSVWGRYGFSDILPLLLALDAKVCLYPDGECFIEDFLCAPPKRGRILTHVLLPKDPPKVYTRHFRRSTSEFPYCVIAYVKETNRLAIGARPERAIFAPKTEKVLRETPEDLKAIERALDEEVIFGTNARAGGEYRKLLCRNLLAQIGREAKDEHSPHHQ